MLKLTDVDALKMEMQSHFDVVEQDCSMSDEYREGVVAGLDAAMFEIDSAPTIEAIPVEWLKKKLEQKKQQWYGQLGVASITKVLMYWQKEQEAQECSGT